MRAVVLREGRVAIRETADATPGPGELLLRTLSTAICASDAYFMDQSPFDVFHEVRAERGLPGPAVVFECVGAAGLIQNIVESAEMATRIYCAGGWYTGDTLDITTATRQGVTIQFGGGPPPQDWARRGSWSIPMETSHDRT
ncbi:MDR/zinc-dependent alcohol dehydrogenase-like family protein [Mycobacterium simulans]|uniref:hypothetical protein n=1 Tax=Mycobacterium simulans TaxID=627089 RepID=UPI001CD74584